MDPSSFIFPLLIVLLAVPLFLQARKQKRAMQEQQKLQNSLGEGDRVMTTSGLFGTIVGSTDDHINLEIAPGVTTTWVRAAIRERVSAEGEDTSDASETESTTSVDATADEDAPTRVAEPIEQQKAT